MILVLLQESSCVSVPLYPWELSGENSALWDLSPHKMILQEKK